MKSLLWFVAGATVGVIAAHVLDKDPRGHELLADIDARIAEFSDRVGDAYREQEAKFSAAVEDARHAASTAASTAGGAVSGAVANVRDAASDLAGRAADAAKDAFDSADDAVAAAWDATREGAEDAGDAADDAAEHVRNAAAHAADHATHAVDSEPGTDPAADAAAASWDVDLQGDVDAGRQDADPVVDSTEADVSDAATSGDGTAAR